MQATNNVANHGKVEITETAAFTQASGTFTNHDSAVVINNGTLDSSSGTFINHGLYQGAGTFIGDLDNVSGIVAPGNSPGTMSVTGTYTLGGTGTLLIEIGGFGAGEYDFVDITGETLLTGGTIQFVPWSYDIGADIGYGQTKSLMFLESDSGITGFDADYLANHIDYGAWGALAGFDFSVYQLGGSGGTSGSLWFSATHTHTDPDPDVVPAPGALLLAGIGIVLVGWTRKLGQSVA